MRLTKYLLLSAIGFTQSLTLIFTGHILLSAIMIGIGWISLICDVVFEK